LKENIDHKSLAALTLTVKLRSMEDVVDEVEKDDAARKLKIISEKKLVDPKHTHCHHGRRKYMCAVC